MLGGGYVFVEFKNEMNNFEIVILITTSKCISCYITATNRNTPQNTS